MRFFELFWMSVVAGAAVGAAAPSIGTFVVQKRLSLIGDGIGHVAFAGVAFALWLDVSPLAAALTFAILGAIGIDAMRRRSPEEADMGLALFFYGSIAMGAVVAQLGGSFNAGLLGILFGQVLTITTGELITIAVLAVFILGVVAGTYRGLVAVAIDEEAAVVRGLPVGALNAGLMLLTALTIGVGMRVVGILLIAAMMVLPVGIARNLVRSFKATLVSASAIGAGCAVAGIAVAYMLDTAPSGTIVLMAVAAYLVSDAFRLARRSLARGRAA
ncbi:MAG: metal ABC transporter permease [Actinomycetota bacterium]